MQGGLSTEQEMCVVFLYYYPKIPLTLCETVPDTESLFNYFGITRAL